MESPKKLYVPRFYGLNKFGKPKVNKMVEGEKIDIKFKGDLDQNKSQLKICIWKTREKRVVELFLLNVVVGKRPGITYCFCSFFKDCCCCS